MTDTSRDIVLVSGHPANWHAGASTVYLHLHAALAAAGQHVDLHHLDAYTPRLPGIPTSVKRYGVALALDHRRLARADADVVEIAGNYGWRAFRRLRAGDPRTRPLLVARLHGLEFLDEQARVGEEIARPGTLPWKYKAVSRHWINWQERATLAAADVLICHSSRDADAAIAAGWASAAVD